MDPPAEENGPPVEATTGQDGPPVNASAEEDRRPAQGSAGDPGGGAPGMRRRVLTAVTAVLAVLLVLAALVAPDRASGLKPGALLRIPLEGLFGVALLLALPARPRRVVAVVAGIGLGLLSLVKLLDITVFAAFERPFDLLADWSLLDDAKSFLTDSIGDTGGVLAVVAAVVIAVAVPLVMTLSVLRVSRLVVRHRTATSRTVAVLAAVWALAAVLGSQVVAGVPVASAGAADLVIDRTLQVRTELRDQKQFAAELAVDAFRDTPGDRLLTALRGKDVVVSWIESYGRSAVEDPRLAPVVDPVLDDGTRRLAAAGYASRSAFLTSPTYGGGSWLAHATLLSGAWVNNQKRYGDLFASDRFTLVKAFGRANWPTVAVEPGNTQDWPEAAFYGYDRVLDSRTIGYHGPKFSWSPVPDQYTLSAFQRLEHGRTGRDPLMAEVTLTSSHNPWAPIPRPVDWDTIGDGSVYDAIARDANTPQEVWQDPDRVRTENARSNAYSVTSLISYVEKYGDDNLVLVFLGDHQPSSIVTGEGASHDVPITIVAHDRAVLDRISGWGWQDGLRPDPQAPVWPMDSFRDRFLTAFGP